MRIISAVALLVLASACATPTATQAEAPAVQTTTTTTSTTTPATTTTATPTTTTPVVASVAIPADLAGRSAARVDQQLRALGLTILRYVGPDGSEVQPDPSWTVVSVDGAGSAMRADTAVYIKVDKPAPPPPPKTSAKVTPKPAPPPVEPVAPPAAAHYKNCAAAKAAGAAPVHRGEPGYGPHLDRDGDGIGCER